MIVAGVLRTHRADPGADPSTNGARCPPNSREGARCDGAFRQLVSREVVTLCVYLTVISAVVFDDFHVVFDDVRVVFDDVRWYLVSSTTLLPHTPFPRCRA